MRELLSTSSRIVLSLFIITAPSIAPSIVRAADFSITGGTSADQQTVTGNDTGNVGSGATLTDDGSDDPIITWTDDDTGTVKLTNSGTISAANDGRAIETSGHGSADQSISLTNSGTITTDNDFFKIKFDDAGTISLQNSGKIVSDTGQVFDFDGLTSTAVNITNLKGGLLQSNQDDAIIAGDAATVGITNSGSILGSLTTQVDPDDAAGRGIDIEGDGGDTRNVSIVNNQGGLIEGDDDALHIEYDDPITGGTISVQNSGTMKSLQGQGIDVGKLVSNGTSLVSITNTATGVIQSMSDDAIHAGDNMNLRITNAGQILGSLIVPTDPDDAAGKAIQIKGDGGADANISIVNEKGGLIESDDDGVHIEYDDPVTGGSISLDNSGTIHSFQGQAVDFDGLNVDPAFESDASTSIIHITNEATGIIRSDDGDGVRPGDNGVVTNYGTIIAKAASGGKSDGVDFQDHGGTVINKSGGLIDGAHTGVTGSGGVTTYNEKGGTITGDNGSGINYDGNGSVYNYGTISGNAIPGSADGDGDGIDIDGVSGSNNVTIENYGTVLANGAQGVHDGGINTADGVAFGGGTLLNGAGGLIKSVQRGVFVDDSAGGDAFQATTLTNDGTIEAGTLAIGFVGNLDDTIINRGIISSASGQAIDMGAGNDTLDIFAGSKIIGSIDGNTGTDKIILEGGSDSFAGATNFEELEIKGDTWTLTGTQDYATSITVDDGATLRSTGLLSTGDLTIAGGGTLAQDHATVGNALAVNGNVTFNDGSTYKVGMNAAGQTDSIAATGTADLDGHLVLTSRDGFKIGNTYTVLTADTGLNGTFDDVTANAPRLTFSATNNGNDVDVVAALSGVSFQDLAGGGGNQEKVAQILDRASDGGVDSSLLDTLNGLSASDLSKAISSLSGESHASVTGISMATAGQFGQQVSGRMGQQRSGNPQTSSVDKFSGLQLTGARSMASDLQDELAALCDTGETGTAIPGITNDFWLRGYGSFGQQDGDSNASGFNYSTGGIVAGYDHHLTDNLLAGISIGYSKTSADFDDSDDSAKINSYDVGLYASYDTGGFYLDGTVNYSLLRNKADRNIFLGGTTDQATSNYDGNRVVLYGETGYVFKFGDTSLQPLGSLQYTWLGQDSFKEHGAGSADLTADSSHMNSLKSGLGLRLSHSFKTGDNTFFTPEIRARWSHEFLDDQSSTETGFADLPGSNFTAQGIRTARDAALIGAGLTVDVTSSVAMVVDYDAYVSADQTVHNISGGLKIKW